MPMADIVSKLKVFSLSLLLLGSAGCATADWAQIADSTTTAVALEAGFSEGNPLFHGMSWPVIAVAKIGATQGAKLLPEPYCEYSLFWLTVTGYGVALWNIGVMLGSGPAALPFVAAITWGFWDDWQVASQTDCAVAKQVLSENAPQY
jgi:hypothetical protein